MTRSAWSHALCDECWGTWRPGQNPVRLLNAAEEFCCVCGVSTTSGIYLRVDPATVPCRGRHDDL